MRRSYTGEQHNPLSIVYRFAVLNQNNMFKHRQKREGGGGGSFCTMWGRLLHRTRKEYSYVWFTSKTKYVFLKKLVGMITGEAVHS